MPTIGRGLEAVDVLKKEGLSPKFHTLDVNDQGSIERLRDDIAAQDGGLDILVNNAGIIFNVRYSSFQYSPYFNPFSLSSYSLIQLP